MFLFGICIEAPTKVTSAGTKSHSRTYSKTGRLGLDKEEGIQSNFYENIMTEAAYAYVVLAPYALRTRGDMLQDMVTMHFRNPAEN